MIPFVLQQHERDRAALRQLQAAELERVSGGVSQCPSPDDIPKMSTTTVGPGGSNDDGCDEN
ncbi:hypothetical protein [Stenotrophomonas rhizophila]|uniref:hypothetical protein n=1 Tax=Stenotrophomonas rhizophila TaxID=216778 RepID=UPI001E60EB20|nr:hypothetical protein [Stenotrophomonas rhizophila]MCC7632784.1 hypothetical protein [Stenotrophomonas rhizophila]MCC7662491.1 hypothetical protein [Stenotrophomonas rhizophila]